MIVNFKYGKTHRASVVETAVPRDACYRMPSRSKITSRRPGPQWTCCVLRHEIHATSRAPNLGRRQECKSKRHRKMENPPLDEDGILNWGYLSYIHPNNALMIRPSSLPTKELGYDTCCQSLLLLCVQPIKHEKNKTPLPSCENNWG